MNRRANVRMRFAGELLSSLIKRGGGQTKAPAVEAGAADITEHRRTFENMTLHQTGNQSSGGGLPLAPPAVRNKGEGPTWLATMLRRAQSRPDGILLEVHDLTPERAAALLERNHENRNISQTNLDGYVSDMLEGRWEFNGETIVISNDGRLNDGQHRCLACVTSGVTIKQAFAFGPDHKTRLTTDTGSKKTAGALAAMEGHKDTNVLAAVARQIWQYDQFGTITRQAHKLPSIAVVLDFIREHPDISESVRFVPSSATTAIGGKSLISFCHYILARSNSERADAFISQLVEGTSLQKGDPILVARKRLIDEKAARALPETRAEVIFRAWNSHVRGLKISKIQLTGEFPEILCPKD